MAVTVVVVGIVDDGVVVVVVVKFVVVVGGGGVHPTKAIRATEQIPRTMSFECFI